VECQSKSDGSNNKGDWDRLKITQTIPQQHMGKHKIKEQQTTAILGTAHKLRKVLM
jgi:hypothetical protein